MTDLPSSLSANLNSAFGGPSPPFPMAGMRGRRIASLEQSILDLCDPELRENALLNLSKRRDVFHDLAPLLWCSAGTIAALLQEVVAIYPALSPPSLSPAASNRVCNALALLQADDTEVISFLLQTEIIPLCLRTMEMGSELSKTVATFIVQKIMLDEVGLQYICATAERFFAVGSVLAKMLATLVEHPSPRLLRHIIRCYLRLSDNGRACEALHACLPHALRDGTFNSFLLEDKATREWLQQLLHKVAAANRVSGLHAGGFDPMMT